MKENLRVQDPHKGPEVRSKLRKTIRWFSLPMMEKLHLPVREIDGGSKLDTSRFSPALQKEEPTLEEYLSIFWRRFNRGENKGVVNVQEFINFDD